jgi:hypothetical protein
MAKKTQLWLRRNFLAFISTKDWPSGNPDFNPLESVGCFGEHGMPKASQQLGEPEEIPHIIYHVI